MSVVIEEGSGNLLTADVQALVNTVNAVGVMGKGIALQFKRAYPANFAAYRAACERGEVRPGSMFVFDTAITGPRRYVINFPTKQHWRSNSRLVDIGAGLDDLVRVVTELGITSVAIPALGCGNGGLDWRVVRPMIEQACARMPQVRAVIFPPAGAPPAASMPNATRICIVGPVDLEEPRNEAPGADGPRPAATLVPRIGSPDTADLGPDGAPAARITTSV